MKKRTKEENAAHSRAQREKKRLAAVSPRITSTVSPAPPISGFCPNCEAQTAEITPLRDLVQTLLAKVATLEANITGSRTTAHLVTPIGENADALRQSVMADKGNRINTFGRNPSIGSARI